MSYELCLEKAGAKIIDTKYTGSYQGTWGCIVEYNGEKVLVTGSYGSCSGCDAFQAEFDYNSAPEEKDGVYYKNDDTWDEDNICTKEEFEQLTTSYDKRLSDFAQSYLQTPYDKEDIEQKLKSFDNDDWFDTEEKELFTWALTHFI